MRGNHEIIVGRSPTSGGGPLLTCHMRTYKGEISIGRGLVRMSPMDLSNFSGQSLTYFKYFHKAHSYTFISQTSLCCSLQYYLILFSSLFQASWKLNDQRYLKNKPWPVCEKKTQMQSAPAMWGQKMVKGFVCHLSWCPKLQEDLTPSVPIQVRALGNAESLTRHQVGQQRLSLRRNQVSFRICTSGVLPLLCCHTCHPMQIHTLTLRALCEKHQSSLPASQLNAILGPHFSPANHHYSLLGIFSARIHVLRNECYSEFFNIMFSLCARGR